MSIPDPIRQGRPCRIAIPEAAARPYAALLAEIDGEYVRLTKGVRTQRDIHGTYLKIRKFPVVSGYPKKTHWNDSHKFFIALYDKRPTDSDGSPTPVDYLELQVPLSPLRCTRCGKTNGPRDDEHAPVNCGSGICSDCERVPPCQSCGIPATCQGPDNLFYCIPCACVAYPNKAAFEEVVYLRGHAHRGGDEEEDEDPYPWDDAPRSEGEEGFPVPAAHSKLNSCRKCRKYFRFVALECDSCSGWNEDKYRVCCSCRDEGVHSAHHLNLIRIVHH